MVSDFLNRLIEQIELFDYADDADFLNTFGDFKLKIVDTDATNYGIIYTPFPTVCQQLAQIPDSYFSDPDLKWLDSGAGIGNYSIVLFCLLYHGLANVIQDRNERCRHIIEDMIYMVEVFPTHITRLREIFGLKANIIERCFLSLVRDEFDDGFDFIIGNPPYNINGAIKTPTNNKLNKSDDGKTVYVDFVAKSLDLLKEGGFLNYIIPSLWLKPDKAGLYRRLTNLKIHSLTPLNTNDSQRVFKYQAQTPTCYFLIQNSPDPNDGAKVFKIWDKYVGGYVDYRLFVDYPIPCYGVSILNKLLDCVAKYGSLVPHKSTTLKKGVTTSKDSAKSHPYKNIVTCRLDGLNPVIQYNWSNEECQYAGHKKLVLAHKMYGFPFLDVGGLLGISSRDNYVFFGGELKNLEGGSELEDIQRYLSTKFALFIFGTTNYRMRYLERYAFEFLPDIRNIEGFSFHGIEDSCEERDKYIADFFGFIDMEREIINKFSRDYTFFI